jgi:Abnormal spindle-like microcephaly-assoc'd, ASPM-SPD-2-Hydin/Immunoglobulin I-set domain
MMAGGCARCWTLIRKAFAGAKQSDGCGSAPLLAALASFAILTSCTGITSASKSNSNPTGSAVAPAITKQPASVTVIAGQTASFSVAATGSGTLTYQWSKNNLAISGANSASYTTPPASFSDNNAKFSVTVTDSEGSAMSSPATLAVSAATAILTPNATSLPFGNVILGSNSILGVAFTNSGNSSVSISNVTISGAGFTASGMSGGQIVTPGATASLNIMFAPAAILAVTGSVTVTSNATNSPATISLTGTGIPATAHSAMLGWTASTSTVSGYNVYRGTVSGGPYTKINSALVTTTTNTDSTVLSGLTYFYVVTALDSNNVESAYSNEVSATIP